MVCLGVSIYFWNLCCLKFSELLDVRVVDLHYFYKILSDDCSDCSLSLLSLSPLTHMLGHFILSRASYILFCPQPLSPRLVRLDNVCEPLPGSPLPSPTVSALWTSPPKKYLIPSLIQSFYG